PDRPRRVAPGGDGPGRRLEAVLAVAAQLLAAQSNHEPKSWDRIGHPLHERDERCSTHGGEGLDRSRCFLDLSYCYRVDLGEDADRGKRIPEVLERSGHPMSLIGNPPGRDRKSVV